MDQKKIGKFLKELRKENGITQEEFAEIMYLSGFIGKIKARHKIRRETNNK